MKTRVLLGRLGLALLGPLIILAGAEGLVRGLGWGYPTTFLRAVKIGGEFHWTDNPFYGYRFFAPEMARNPAPISIAQAKPAGTTRIAVLGESAAQGDPMIEYGLPRMLERMLNAGTSRVEVINAAMTAISSPIVADIARELAVIQPDLVVVYMGNNEVVGPYGPGTVFTSRKSFAWLTPWRVQLTRLRLASVLRALGAGWRTQADPADAWRGLAMFNGLHMTQDDPRLAPMYRAFARNLDAIITTAQGQGARVLLSTVAVNLVDCAPFGSRSPDLLPEKTRQRWQASFTTGVAAQEGGLWAEAQRAFAQAEDAFPGHAETVYRHAQVLAEQGDMETARAGYLRARDLDTQRFRADHRINELIRAAAQRHGVELIDAEALFLARAPDRRGPGADLFLDHVHFTFSGTWQLARYVAEIIQGPSGPAVPDEDTCRHLLFYSPWAERLQATLIQQRRARPPFTQQAGNPARLRELNERIKRSYESINTQDLTGVAADYQQLVERYPADFFLPLQWGTILGESGRWAEAVPVLLEAQRRLPLHVETRLPAVHALCRVGRPEEGARLLAGEDPPYGLYLADYAVQLLNALMQDGYPAEARRLQTALLELVPRFPQRDRVVDWAEIQEPGP